MPVTETFVTAIQDMVGALDEAGNVYPGVGGNPNDRMGFGKEGRKASGMPEFVRHRIQERRQGPASEPKI